MLDITDIGQAARTIYWILLAGTALCALFALLALRIRGISAAIRLALIGNAAIVAILLIVFSALFVQRAVLKGYAISGDEASMYYQGQIFAAGKLWNEPAAPELRRLFPRHHVVVQGGREYSKYPPATSLITALAIRLGDGRAFNMAVTALSLILLLWLGRLLSGGWTVPVFAVLPFLFSTTVLFHAASYFSHPAAMLFLLATLVALLLGERDIDPKRRGRFALLAGLFLALLLLTRPFDAALTALAVALYHLWDLARGPVRRAVVRRWAARWREWLGLAVGGGIGAALFFGYQKLYTGSFFLSPYRIYDMSGEVMAELTLTADQLFGRGLGEIALSWLARQAGWSSAVVMVLAVLYMLIRNRKVRRFERLVLLLPLCFIVGYAFHPLMGGDSYGARYYYPVLWCWFYAAAALIHYLARRFERGRGAFLYLLFLIAVTVPFQAQIDEKCRSIGQEIDRRFAIYDEMESLIPSPERAVVLLKRAPTFDPSFYVRNDPDHRDRIVYGKMVPQFMALRQLEAAFPGRTVYYYDIDRLSGRGRLEQMNRRREER